MSNELPEEPNALQKLMARFRNAAKGFRGGYKNEIDSLRNEVDSLRNEVDSYRQEEQAVREKRKEAEAQADKLSKWEIKIREENYNVQDNKRANEERAKELSDYSKALEKRAREIEEAATRRAYKLLDEYKADLNQREAALNQGEAALSDKKDAVSDREARVDGLERLLKDDRILPESEDPKKTATRLAFISRMQDLQEQLDDLDSICSETKNAKDEKLTSTLKRSRDQILGRLLALIAMDEIIKRTK